MNFSSRVSIVDSHTGGEPTRVVLAGEPDLGSGSLAQRREILRSRFDEFRSAVINEPRGSDVLVGALICPPSDPACAAGVIFFNNVGTLGMCGHGMIGLMVTLAHLNRITVGAHRIETPVGVVEATLHDPHTVAVQNVASHRFKKDVTVSIDSGHSVTGDIAWGGNWFFLVKNHGLELRLANVETLIAYAWKIRKALATHGVTGLDGAEIDHVELFGPPVDVTCNSRNFVLCPGKAYDRSPCGTGTSAKIACLIADGTLQLGQTWRQESITGSVFEGSASLRGKDIVPTIRGTAFVTSEATLLFQDRDPLRLGIRS